MIEPGDGGRSDRPSFLGRAGCLIVLALVVISDLAALLGAIAYLRFTHDHARAWPDIFSPSFWWEYACSPLGAPLTIAGMASSLLALALLGLWPRRTR
jgi:hypothetical protein